MRKLTFRRWLDLQKFRDDPVGDLSRDFLEDDCAKWLRSPDSIRRHILYVHGACDGAVTALNRAIREYHEVTDG